MRRNPKSPSRPRLSCKRLLEADDQSVLCEVLGKTDIAHDPHQTGDEPRRLDPPDRVDRAMRVGSRHC